MIKAVQQFAIRSAMKNERCAAATLSAAREAGYEGIEMCGFLMRPMPLLIRGFAAMAGMPIGPCGKLDWRRLIGESGLKVVSVHEDLDTVTGKTDAVEKEAADFGTDKVVVTGMFKFDYSDRDAVLALADRLNEAGQALGKRGLRFLYHNHNCELCPVGGGSERAFDLIIDRTDPVCVGFEFDSYWIAEAGADPCFWMDRLGARMELWHINDRGFRAAGKTASIRKSDGIELGYGNMPLVTLARKASSLGVSAAILENHSNWADGDPVKSLRLSSVFMNRYISAGTQNVADGDQTEG